MLSHYRHELHFVCVIHTFLEKLYEGGGVPALIQHLTKFMFRNRSCQSQQQMAGHHIHVCLRATGIKRLQW